MGFSIASITTTSTGPFVDSSFRPSLLLRGDNRHGSREAHGQHQSAHAISCLRYFFCPTSGRGSATKPSRFGILTFGRLFASMTPFSGMMPLMFRMYAVTA